MINKEIKKNISSTSARAREVENLEVLDGKEEKENQQKKERKRRFTLILGKNEAKLLHCAREKQKKFLKIIFLRCNNFHPKKASNRVRGKNNTLPPLAENRIRICK